jgi:hypothetical protein
MLMPFQISMSDSIASAHFKISAARGMLDVALVAAFCTHIAAWAALGISCGFARESKLSAAMACVSGVSGLLTLWLLIRVAIDRRLFSSLARATVTHDLASSVRALDEALLELGWINDEKSGRSIDARVQGVSGLLKRVIAILLIQVVVLCIVVPFLAFRLA